MTISTLASNLIICHPQLNQDILKGLVNLNFQESLLEGLFVIYVRHFILTS